LEIPSLLLDFLRDQGQVRLSTQHSRATDRLTIAMIASVDEALCPAALLSVGLVNGCAEVCDRNSDERYQNKMLLVML